TRRRMRCRTPCARRAGRWWRWSRARRWVRRGCGWVLMVERVRAEWPASVTVAVALLFAFAGLHMVLEGWAWWWWIFALTTLSLGVGLAARALGWGPVWS